MIRQGSIFDAQPLPFIAAHTPHWEFCLIGASRLARYHQPYRDSSIQGKETVAEFSKEKTGVLPALAQLGQR
jgi:hypothetical protein